MKSNITELRAKADAAVRVAGVAASEDERDRGPLLAAALLNEVERFIARFVCYPTVHARVAHALWIAHAHLMECFDSTPRIAFLSPEPGSGKSRALEVTELLVPRPIQTINATPAYLFRRIGAVLRPTVLFDEVDAIWGPKAKHENEEVRALINAGHRRHSTIGRCVLRGNVVATEETNAFAAVAMAGLGDLPDTVLTRSVVIRMRRRAPGDKIEAFRRREQESEGTRLRGALERWAAIIEPKLVDARPAMPDGVADRDADVWEALLAVADAAGGHWPDRARAAAQALVAEAKSSTPSLGVKLLSDLKVIFAGASHLSTEAILRKLAALDESPWGDLRGKPLDSRGLASRLRPYGIRSGSVRDEEFVVKGYRRADLFDAWERYVPTSSPLAATSATGATPSVRIANRPRIRNRG
jgi:hypothetical protein